jgi:hypothetical protein
VRDMRRAPVRPLCPRCWRRTKPVVLRSEDYAELLGLYLGDGCLSRLGRTYALRISLDSRYPQLIAEAEALMQRCLPENPVRRVLADDAHTTVLKVHSRHLPCLFPQHGPGPKHRRTIALEPWQEEHVAAAPYALLRGLIRSDGCAFINRTGPYEYLSYDFTNRSAGILDLFATTCESVGVEYRRYERHIRVYRRASVALLEAHVGTKR